MDSGANRRDFWISSASIIGTMSIEESQDGEIRFQIKIFTNLLIIFDKYCVFTQFYSKYDQEKFLFSL